MAKFGICFSMPSVFSYSSNWTTHVFVSFAGLIGKTFTDILEAVRKKIGKSTACSVQAPLLCFLCEVFHAVDTLRKSAKNQIEPINSFQRDKPQFPEFITNILLSYSILLLQNAFLLMPFLSQLSFHIPPAHSPTE